MAGRRIVDAAKLFHASKSIAQKHVALRSSQWDAYSKTSTLAKSVKNQTDRVTLTAAAAITLAQRFSEESPAYAKSAAQRATGPQYGTTARQEGAKATTPTEELKEGLEPAHRYDRSEENATTRPAPEGELRVKQKDAPRRPLPDGTIPTAGLTLEHEGKSQDTNSELPVPESPSASDGGPPRASGNGLRPIESAESTIPIPRGPVRTSKQVIDSIPLRTSEKQQPVISSRLEKFREGHDRDVFDTPTTSSEQKIQQNDGQLQDEQIPEGINTDVFHSRKVARMLGSDPFSRKEIGEQRDTSRSSLSDRNLPKSSGRHPLDDRPLPQSNALGSSSNDELKSASPARYAHDAEPTSTVKEMEDLASQLAQDVQCNAAAASESASEMSAPSEPAPYSLRESRVPSSRFGRLWQYAGLGTSMALGAVGEGLRRATGTAASTTGSLMLSPANLEILVSKLSRMRGAALKLGQMISFQDTKMLPPAIHDVLQRVQDSADYMPASQRNKVLAENLGDDWQDLFESFGDIPIAAASIGQVHKAVLRSTGQSVAVKIQYPGVANSIDSDLSNLSILLTASRLLPKGLFLDKTIANARTELGWECDYVREAESQTRFRNLLQDDTSSFTVPKVFPEACGPTVLTAEFMAGIGVTKLKTLTQEQRDWIGTQILRLCLREIVEFKFMQTDPNWTNFLYNASAQKVELLDFGASRDYPDEFVEPYIKVLIAASKGDKSSIRDLSLELGYLTGSESSAMLEAHTQSVLTLAEPFNGAGPDVYDFRDQTITDRVRGLIPVMVKERLAPPPEETYSLHRKLSGAFLLCAKLGSRVPCKKLFADAVSKWEASK